MKTPFVAALVLTALLFSPAGAVAAGQPDAHVQLLAINDLHGHLAPNTPGTIQSAAASREITNGVQTGWTQNTVPAGGIAYLAAHIKSLRATNPNTITVGAGDMIGASPLVSALFHDEPAIEALNSIGLDVTGVGNHEFDEGVDELLRMRTATSSVATAAIRSTAARTGRRSADRSSSTWRERLLRRHGHHDLPAVRGPRGRQREARVHRPHVRGHADRRDAERVAGLDFRPEVRP